MKKSAVILSGGKNSRMNYNTKAFLKFSKERFIDLELKAIEMFDEIIISCNDEKSYKDLGYKLVKDEIRDIGPLGGMYSSLKECKYDEVLIIASDMPFIDRNFIEKLYKYEVSKDALILRINSNIEPLCSIYKKKCIDKILKMIHKKDYKIKNLINNLDIEYLDLDDENKIRNINTVKEYESLIRK